FHVTGLYGPGIWVSDPYGLTGKVQAVNPAWGAEGFDPFVPGGIASHHIAADNSHLQVGSFVSKPRKGKAQSSLSLPTPHLQPHLL
ncbi:hypothetical protein ACOICX_27705, partial [Klebsiella pneumoniae]